MDELKDAMDDDKILTAVAREITNDALKMQSACDGDFTIYNPMYMTTEDKENLLDKIPADYIAENPKAKTMSFTAIK